MFLGAARVWVEAGVPNCLKPWGVAVPEAEDLPVEVSAVAEAEAGEKS